MNTSRGCPRGILHARLIQALLNEGTEAEAPMADPPTLLSLVGAHAPTAGIRDAGALNE